MVHGVQQRLKPGLNPSSVLPTEFPAPDAPSSETFDRRRSNLCGVMQCLGARSTLAQLTHEKVNHPLERIETPRGSYRWSQV